MELQRRGEKKRLKKWVKVTIGSLIGLGLFLGVVSLGNMLINEIVNAGVRDTGEGDKLDTIREQRLNGNGVTHNWNEDQVLTTMNRMTHQKVNAGDKWGAVEMTHERIIELMYIVEDSSYDNKEELMSILARWESGDFSRVDKDHNAIWSMQGGTIGEAYGIMNSEEEKEFIESTFR